MVRDRHMYIIGGGIGLGGSFVAALAILWLLILLGRFTSVNSGRSGEVQPLLGQVAPDFQLESLDGGQVDLAQHRDKDVVILDFWATWCGPCRRGLPTIARVAAKFRERGVVFYAVDQDESAEDVRKFLADEGLDVSVLLDRGGAVGTIYHVKGIPQTVLIGKDGTVKVVHVGLSDDLESRLSGELHELLGDKRLSELSQ